LTIRITFIVVSLVVCRAIPTGIQFVVLWGEQYNLLAES
jgi:hypothetical protein